jgi:signal recognition particle subunit SRP54
MFETLTGRLNQIFDQLRRRGKLSEADVDAAMREVRLALLEADVHFSVVKTFIARVRERAVGAEVSKALNPGQQVIKIVNEELIATLGEPAPLNLTGPKPRVIMMVGLQGSGKTTRPLANWRADAALERRTCPARGWRPIPSRGREAVAATRRAAGCPCRSGYFHQAAELAKRAFDKAEKGGYGVVIVDTAGRSQLDAIDGRVESHRMAKSTRWIRCSSSTR